LLFSTTLRKDIIIVLTFLVPPKNEEKITNAQKIGVYHGL